MDAKKQAPPRPSADPPLYADKRQPDKINTINGRCDDGGDDENEVVK